MNMFTLIMGVFVVLLGVSIILNVVFGIDVPVLRVAFAFLLIFVGIRILVGPRLFAPRVDDTHAIMTRASFEPIRLDPDGENEFNVIFGQGVVDLTGIERPSRATDVKVSAVFADVLVRVDPATPYVVKGSAVFGQATLPERRTAAFGDAEYRSEASAEEPVLLRLEVNAVFGAIRVVEEPHEERLPVPSGERAAAGGHST